MNQVTFSVSLAIFVLVLESAFTGVALADNENGPISNASMVMTYVQGLKTDICGNHICAPGEVPQAPKAVGTVGGRSP